MTSLGTFWPPRNQPTTPTPKARHFFFECPLPPPVPLRRAKREEEGAALVVECDFTTRRRTSRPRPPLDSQLKLYLVIAHSFASYIGHLDLGAWWRAASYVSLSWYLCCAVDAVHPATHLFTRSYIPV
jgi:hypothetical protein